MNAALDLGVTGPAAAARIFARLYRLRAREAADREIAIGDQRIFAQRMRAHVVGLIRRRPMRQRVDADARAHRLEYRQCRPRRSLEALAPGEPGAKRLDPARQRLDLAHVATGIGVGLVKPA